MEELRKKVEELEKEYDQKEQIRILQEINKALLTKYCIKVGSIEIRPIRIEAYYFHPEKFEDSTVHGVDQQRKSEVLYRHSQKEIIDVNKDNGGVDLCLAYYGENNVLASYYLSFLIKNSWVKTSDFEKYCKQIELNKILNEYGIEDGEVTFEPMELNHVEDLAVFHTIRKGLSGKPFGREPLASLIDINRKAADDPSKSIFDFAAGCGKEQILAEYLWSHPEENNEANREKWYGSANNPTWQKNIDKLTDKLKKS